MTQPATPQSSTPPRLNPNRANTITQKVATRFGNLYAHISHDDSGRIVDIAFSTPSKHGDTAVEEALINLGMATAEVIESINEAFQPQEQANGEERKV